MPNNIDTAKRPFWTMHSFPGDQKPDAENITKQCVYSGYIAIDHDELPNKPLRECWAELKELGYEQYYAFCEKLSSGHSVLIFLQGRPYAFATVEEDCKFNDTPNTNIPFRHRAKIKNTIYIKDHPGLALDGVEARGAIRWLEDEDRNTYRLMTQLLEIQAKCFPASE